MLNHFLRGGTVKNSSSLELWFGFFFHEINVDLSVFIPSTNKLRELSFLYFSPPGMFLKGPIVFIQWVMELVEMLSSKSGAALPNRLGRVQTQPSPHWTERFIFRNSAFNNSSFLPGLFMIVFYGWKLQNICRDFSRERGGKKKGQMGRIKSQNGFGSFCCVWEVQWPWKEQGWGTPEFMAPL